jgi:hypothetical protein
MPLTEMILYKIFRFRSTQRKVWEKSLEYKSFVQKIFVEPMKSYSLFKVRREFREKDTGPFSFYRTVTDFVRTLWNIKWQMSHWYKFSNMRVKIIKNFRNFYKLSKFAPTYVSINKNTQFLRHCSAWNRMRNKNQKLIGGLV